VDIPSTQGLRLDDYGVKRQQIVILGVNATTIEFYRSEISKGVFRARGFHRPTAQVIPKEHGISVDGTAVQAYLLFEDKGSGCQVYLDDTSDTKQNEYALLVVPGRNSRAAQQAPRTPPPRPYPLPNSKAPTERPAPPAPSIETTSSAPHYSLLGETLLYHGSTITERVGQDAARAGLNRDLYVQERVWAEKERNIAGADHAEFERLKSRRLERETAETKAAVDRMRAALLGESQ
jgi:hypothetical protein